MSIDFDAAVDRRGTGSIKWDRYRERDMLPMWVADMDFRAPPALLEALRRRIDHGVFGYGGPPAELVDVTVALLHRAYGWRVDPAWMLWLPGLVSGIHLSCRAVGQPGDEVITTVPIYPPFLTAPALSDRTCVRVQLDQVGSRWEIDFDRLAAAITPRSRLMLLCNPHNPVGRIFSRGELETLARLCLEHDLVLCSDEIHCQLLLDADRPHIPTASLGHEIAARTITLLAPSKTYNIAGLGCSLAIIPDAALRQRFERVGNGIVPHVNVLGYTAALAAYRDGESWLAELIDYLRANRELLVSEIARLPGLKATRPEATYLAWIDARGLGIGDPAAYFEEYGVGLSDGREFGAPGFVRFNFGCPRDLVREALARMARAASGTGPGGHR